MKNGKDLRKIERKETSILLEEKAIEHEEKKLAAEEGQILKEETKIEKELTTFENLKSTLKDAHKLRMVFVKRVSNTNSFSLCSSPSALSLFGVASGTFPNWSLVWNLQPLHLSSASAFSGSSKNTPTSLKSSADLLTSSAIFSLIHRAF